MHLEKRRWRSAPSAWTVGLTHYETACGHDTVGYTRLRHAFVAHIARYGRYDACKRCLRSLDSELSRFRQLALAKLGGPP
jgi:hypothetical protein